MDNEIMDEQVPESELLSQDELNRLWQHGLHEERLFHDRLNYFSAVEIGLLSVFAILYNKDRPFGLLAPLTVAALVFTLFWLILQYNHWRYCLFINSRIRELVPEFRHTVDAYFGQSGADKQKTGFNFSKPLSLAPPVIFALTWIAFLIWVMVNPFSATRQTRLKLGFKRVERNKTTVFDTFPGRFRNFPAIDRSK